MTILLIIAGLSIYLASGLLAYSGTFADFQRRHPQIAQERAQIDRSLARQMAILGPIGLLVVALSSGLFKHGFAFRRRKQ